MRICISSVRRRSISTCAVRAHSQGGIGLPARSRRRRVISCGRGGGRRRWRSCWRIPCSASSSRRAGRGCRMGTTRVRSCGSSRSRSPSRPAYTARWGRYSRSRDLRRCCGRCSAAGRGDCRSQYGRSIWRSRSSFTRAHSACSRRSDGWRRSCGSTGISFVRSSVRRCAGMPCARRLPRSQRPCARRGRRAA